jgi:2-succinyl-6-hydroxy-2,4-cyclohexadiene-1-carboxylate synthase
MGQGRVEPTWGELDQIRCPALLITGAQDHKYTALARRMARLLPRARHVEIEQVGHCAHLEAIEPVSSVIREWLSSLPNLHHSEG